MGARLNHANIVAHDPERLGTFYVEVFGCVRFGPDRHLSGDYLERGMGLPGARVDGFFLRFPGHGDDGPALEIFSLAELQPGTSVVNRPGLMHLCFNVDDIHETVRRILAGGGRLQGEIVEAEVKGVGTASFVNTRDPEDNVVELLQWH
jgi:glyoxylase I family protein